MGLQLITIILTGIISLSVSCDSLQYYPITILNLNFVKQSTHVPTGKYCLVKMRLARGVMCANPEIPKGGS